MQQEYIRIKGARENNLKNVSLEIPKRKITIFTGVSGSGKSSMVFDTIGAEAQRQLNETFSMFIRNRLPRISQPEADAIENLSTAIVIVFRFLLVITVIIIVIIFKFGTCSKHPQKSGGQNHQCYSKEQLHALKNALKNID